MSDETTAELTADEQRQEDEWKARQIETGIHVQENGVSEAVEAIQFALEVDDHFDRMAFLQEWIVGNSYEEWPEFKTDAVSPQMKKAIDKRQGREHVPCG